MSSEETRTTTGYLPPSGGGTGLLVVVHALRDRDVIRIISARKAARLEIREYEIRLR